MEERNIVVTFMLFNIAISCLAAGRQLERYYCLEPKNKLDVLLDKYYPDEFMDKVFSNKKNV